MTRPDHDDTPAAQVLTPVDPDSGAVVSAGEAAAWASVYRFEGDAHARLLQELTGQADPAERARLLHAMAEHSSSQSGRHFGAFGPALVDGASAVRNMTESLEAVAELQVALGEVEFTRAGEGPRRVADRELARVIEDHTGPALEQMTTADTATMRRLMTEDIHRALVDVIGRQAARQLATIAGTLPD